VLKHLGNFVVIRAQESAKTHLILGALTDASLPHKVASGVRVPGIYGPAREEWAGMGLPAMPRVSRSTAHTPHRSPHPEKLRSHG